MSIDCADWIGPRRTVVEGFSMWKLACHLVALMQGQGNLPPTDRLSSIDLPHASGQAGDRDRGGLNDSLAFLQESRES